MPVVLEIRPPKKHLCAVLLDTDFLPTDAPTDSYGNLLLDSDYCDEIHLKAAQRFSDDELEELVKESERRRAKSRALWLLSRQNYCSGALLKKLCAVFSEEAAQYATARMCELKLIDDQAYAQRLAEAMICEKGIAPKRAPYLMAAKGVDLQLAKEVVQSREDDPRVQIAEIIERKYLPKIRDPKGAERTVAALQRKGFSWSDIRAVMQKYSEEIDEFGE